MSIFKFNKNKEEENTSKEVGKSTYFYSIVFLIVLGFALFSNFFGSTNTKKQETTPVEIVDQNLFESLKDNNFEIKFLIIKDMEIKKYIIERESINTEIVTQIYKDTTEKYIIKENKVYKDEKIIETSIFDKTESFFMNIENIKNLINNKTYEIDLKEENYDIKRYKIEMSTLLASYNKISKEDIKKLVSGEIIIDVNYKNKDIESIKMDLTALYKNLEFDYENVIYYIEFSNKGKIKLN